MRTLLLLLLTGCTRGGDGYYGTTEPKHGPDVIWTNLGSEPEYIDPGMTSDSSGGTVVFSLFAGLTQADPKTLDPLPDIATRWDVSPDGRRYTFHLRESVWSDGVPLTAHDFEYSWKRVLDPATGSKYATFLYPLRYGEMFQRGAVFVRGVSEQGEHRLRERLAGLAEIERVRMAPELSGAFVVLADDDAARSRVLRALPGEAVLADASMVSVRAIDDRTLVVDLEDPLPYFLHLVKFYTAMPVPRHVIERLKREHKNPDLWTRAEHIVSNGPYVLREWKFRQHMRLQRNPRYWDAGSVRTQEIRLAMVESYNTTLHLYEAGELDSIGNSALPSEFMDRLSSFRDFRRSPYMGSYFYWLNVKEPPLDDVRVRRALSLAMDREALVRHVARGGQIPTADLVPDGLAGYSGLRSTLFDPEAARSLLRAAGYGPARPLPRITLRYNTSEGHKQLAEGVQAMWKRRLGIDVELENQEWKVYLKTLETHDFQVARQGWIGDYPDPYTFLELLASGNGNNHSNWADPEYDALLRQANATLEPAARLSLLRRAEQRLMDAGPVIPLYVYTRSELVKPYLAGHTSNYEARLMFKHWYIDTGFRGRR